MTPRLRRIHSENDAFQTLEALKRSREKRASLGEFFVEGKRPLELAVDKGWNVRCLAYAEGRPLSDWARGLMAKARPDIQYELSPELFAKLSDKNEPGELLAVIRAAPESVDRIAAVGQAPLLALVCDRPSSPGNLGSLIRSADSFRAGGIVLSGHCVDPWDSACIRASVGSIFALPVLRIQSPREVLAWADSLRAKMPGLVVAGTSARAEQSLEDENWTGPRIVLLGNETSGLCRAYRDAAEVMVRIPIHGVSSSVNVAVAGSIVLYEIDRQRRRAFERRPE